MKKQTKMGVSGEVGSFSEEAGLLYAKNHNIHVQLEYLTDMEGVLSAVENETVDLGIFPVVNSRGGLVKEAFDAMGRYNFKVIEEVWMTVHQCLLGRVDTMSDQIENIVSHSQAIRQCKGYIEQYYSFAEIIVWQDTAKAARDLSQGKLPEGSAVIAPERAASVYGLKVLARDIQDVNPNITTFIVVKKHKNLGSSVL